MPERRDINNLDLQERALHYGDGLFETLLKIDQQIPHWQAHYARLSHGCKRLSIAVPDQDWLKQQVVQATIDSQTCVVKIIVSRGIGGRGMNLPKQDQASVFVLNYPYSTPSKQGIAVSMCQTRLPINPNLAGIKHLNRLDYILAGIELNAHGQVDEGIICDSEGFLVEGLISNLFFAKGGKVYTPSLEMAGVDGIMRQLVLKRLKQMNVPVEIGRFKPELLLQSSECFLSNSVRGIAPIILIDQQLFKVGKYSKALIAALNHEPDSQT